MECPYCRDEMDKGVIQSAREIFWSINEKKVFFIADVSNGDVSIAPFGWNGSKAEAYLCNNCKKVIIDF
ncbi:hypothetical protein KQI88_14790 [Alkaliphilus sp. MSJ-5]|uniref:DUF6487 domain-containing protein n=1 Tax=Alkaliphilus flagellatus TaxID=2841507 RepID=A0ABS6G8D8_9FIRM|nr:PF20097 family protein [Alkaliphilus flagellatus]MBU5677685.1 hypothetical protein [Alkaliphilus flagellatus]